jgi:tRNA threonylcarbamoyladenosine biosynthesis protein TsaE
MNSLLHLTIKSKNETQKLGKTLAKILNLEDVICFEGDLGVGKTFLCRSIINLMTKIKEVPSPTFNLVLTYPLCDLGDKEILHCDFYRLNHFQEVEEIGVFENLKKK